MGLICEKNVCAVICSASEELSERLKRMLRRWALSECVSLSVEETDRFPFREERSAELVLLDMDSVELPEQGRPDKGGLIVISRDAGRAIHSYRWHPAAFLKPDFDERRLNEALAACERYWQKGRVCLKSSYVRREFRLPLGRVRFVEAAAHYCLFNQGKHSVRFRYPTRELEELLPSPPFVRCHRSYLVHLDAVKEITYSTLLLRDGEILPLGRTYIKSLRDALRSWREGELPHEDFDPGLRRSAGGADEYAPEASAL